MSNLKLLCCIALLLTPFSCTEEKPLVVICLADFSSSIPPETIEQYKQVIIQSVLSNLDEKDQVYVLPIDKASESGSTEILAHSFGDNKYSNEFAPPQSKEKVKERNFNAAKEKVIKDFNASYDSAIQKRKMLSAGTDIIGALITAQKYQKKDMENLVILFSDMIQSSRTADMETALGKPQDMEAIIAATPVASLEGMNVIVFTGQQSVGLSAQHYSEIQQFWKKYFEKTNATLLDYSSGAVTVIEDKILTLHQKQ